MAHDVFISYSSRDKGAADGLCAALEQARIRCWIAPRDVLPGLAYSGQIVRAIESCRVMVLVFSSNSNASEEVLREVQLASRNRKHIVNFRIEEVQVCADLDYYLSVPHWLDALTTPMERHHLQLAVSVKALLEMEGASVPMAQGDKDPPRETTHPHTPKRHTAAKSKPLAMYYGIAGVVIVGIFGLVLYSVLRSSGNQMVNPKVVSGEERSESGQAVQAHSESGETDHTGISGVASITNKLRKIIIPVLNIEDSTVEETIDFLRLRASELDDEETDPAKKGVNFVIRRPKSGQGSTDPGSLRIKELRLRNAPLAVALKYVCEQAKLRYQIDDFAVTLVPATETGEDLFTRAFRVPADFFSKLQQILAAGPKGVETDPFAADDPFGQAVSREMELLKECGITFPEGTSVTFLAANESLVVCNTSTNLDRIEELIQVTVNR